MLRQKMKRVILATLTCFSGTELKMRSNTLRLIVCDMCRHYWKWLVVFMLGRTPSHKVHAGYRDHDKSLLAHWHSKDYWSKQFTCKVLASRAIWFKQWYITATAILYAYWELHNTEMDGFDCHGYASIYRIPNCKANTKEMGTRCTL